MNGLFKKYMREEWVHIKATHEKLNTLITISSENGKESFTTNSLNVIEEGLGTKNFESL